MTWIIENSTARPKRLAVISLLPIEPIPTGFDKAIYDRLASHCVSLLWLDEPIPGLLREGDCPGPTAWAVSGFVMSVDGLWYLVTAGHILEGLRRRLTEYRRLVAARILDCFAIGEFREPFPISLNIRSFMAVVDDDFKIDIGVMPLGDYERRNLASAGIVPIDETLWDGTPAPNIDCYLLWGLPKEMKSLRFLNDGGDIRFHIDVTAPLIRVGRVSESETNPDRMDVFHAKVSTDFGSTEGQAFSVHDIDGMSGGPIFGVERQANRYSLVAIQSSWDKSNRVLTANFARFVGLAIRELMRQTPA